MFCPTCGKEINDNAVICPNCGCPTNNQPPQQAVAPATSAPMLENGEKPGMATAALVCAFLVPIVGLILGIAGAVKYQTKSLKNRCIAAIPISIVVWALSFIVLASNM